MNFTIKPSLFFMKGKYGYIAVYQQYTQLLRAIRDRNFGYVGFNFVSFVIDGSSIVNRVTIKTCLLGLGINIGIGYEKGANNG